MSSSYKIDTRIVINYYDVPCGEYKPIKARSPQSIIIKEGEKRLETSDEVPNLTMRMVVCAALMTKKEGDDVVALLTKQKLATSFVSFKFVKVNQEGLLLIKSNVESRYKDEPEVLTVAIEYLNSLAGIKPKLEDFEAEGSDEEEEKKEEVQ